MYDRCYEFRSWSGCRYGAVRSESLPRPIERDAHPSSWRCTSRQPPTRVLSSRHNRGRGPTRRCGPAQQPPPRARPGGEHGIRMITLDRLVNVLAGNGARLCCCPRSREVMLRNLVVHDPTDARGATGHVFLAAGVESPSDAVGLAGRAQAEVVLARETAPLDQEAAYECGGGGAWCIRQCCGATWRDWPTGWCWRGGRPNRGEGRPTCRVRGRRRLHQGPEVRRGRPTTTLRATTGPPHRSATSGTNDVSPVRNASAMPPFDAVAGHRRARP